MNNYKINFVFSDNNDDVNEKIIALLIRKIRDEMY